MSFEALDVAITLIEQLRPLVEQIAKRDRALADQIRRAGSGVALQLAEGAERVGRDRTHLFRVARGSTLEVDAALRVAVAWRYIDDAPAVAVALDRLRAMLWRLTR